MAAVGVTAMPVATYGGARHKVTGGGSALRCDEGSGESRPANTLSMMLRTTTVPLPATSTRHTMLPPHGDVFEVMLHCQRTVADCGHPDCLSVPDAANRSQPSSS